MEDVADNMNEAERYDRQERLFGKEGQEKIFRTKVTIIGDGPCAMYTAIPLVALGIGEVRIIGGRRIKRSEKFMDFHLYPGDAAVRYAQALKLLNPGVRVLGLPMDLESRVAKPFLEGTHMIVDTTNDPRSKAIALEYARKEVIPMITAGVGRSSLKIMMCRREVKEAYYMPNFEGERQGNLVSLLCGGLIAEEVKKLALVEHEDFLKRSICYTQGVDERFYLNRASVPYVPVNIKMYRDISVLAVGGGALGNIMCPALAEIGVGHVDYLDYDDIESTNLNRQVLFHDSVGKNKSTVLARKHRVMNPKARTRGFVQRFDVRDGVWKADGLRKRYDVVLDMVDDPYARAMVSAWAVLRDIPLVRAASSPKSAQVVTYVPGKTACMDHVFSDYYERAIQAEIVRRRSCIAQPDPSVIVTNQVGAALGALELMKIFDNRQGKLFNGVLRYGTNSDPRLSTTEIKDVCDCYLHKQVPDLEITEC